LRERDTNNIATNTTNIQTNAGIIATNADNIQTNSNDIATLYTTVGGLQSDIIGLRSDIADNRKRIGANTEGVSMAMAMAGTFLPQPDETIRLSANWGNFEGSNALAFSGAVSLPGRTYLTAGVGVGLERNTVGSRAGVSVGW